MTGKPEQMHWIRERMEIDAPACAPTWKKRRRSSMDQTISKGFVFLENAPELMRLLEDIFTDDFMQEYTRFESFEASGIPAP